MSPSKGKQASSRFKKKQEPQSSSDDGELEDIDVDNAYMTAGAKIEIIQSAMNTREATEKKVLTQKLARVGIKGSLSLSYKKQPLVLQAGVRTTRRIERPDASKQEAGTPGVKDKGTKTPNTTRA